MLSIESQRIVYIMAMQVQTVKSYDGKTKLEKTLNEQYTHSHKTTICPNCYTI